MGRKKNYKEEPLKKQLWKAADKLRKNIDAAKYKHIVFGLIDLVSNIALCGAKSRSADILGHLINRRTREFSKEDIQKIVDAYHNRRNPEGNYEDVKGFCNSASIERVKELDYVLTPGRYVGLPDDEDNFDFNERFTQLKAELKEQMIEEERLNILILENLKKVKLV